MGNGDVEVWIEKIFAGSYRLTHVILRHKPIERAKEGKDGKKKGVGKDIQGT